MPNLTDIYNFAGWLTTRPGMMKVGSAFDAAPMADAVGEYLNKFTVIDDTFTGTNTVRIVKGQP